VPDTRKLGCVAGGYIFESRDLRTFVTRRTVTSFGLALAVAVLAAGRAAGRIDPGEVSGSGAVFLSGNTGIGLRTLISLR
jgi:hypothetical protein